jgi:hypothetical protein
VATNWTPAQERALTEVISVRAARQEWIDSLEITEFVKHLIEREIPVAPEHATFPGPSSVALSISSLPGAEMETVSSPFGVEKPARQFWFNVNAELIIYGATEPSARVTIGGRPIRLRPDGSFSYRFALPDGAYELPAAATSVDNDIRQAALKFSRQTEYRGQVGAHPQDQSLKVPAPENVV